MRTIAVAFALAVTACGSSKDSDELITDLRIERHRDLREGRWSLEVTLGIKLAEAIPEDHELKLRTVCQAGNCRVLDIAGLWHRNKPRIEAMPLEPGKRHSLETFPFVINDLWEKPSMCELEFSVAPLFGDDRPPRVLATYCATKDVKPEKCPPNKTTPPKPGAEASADLRSVSIDPASDLFPEALLLRYFITAHTDLRSGAWVQAAVTCGGRTEDVWHTDAWTLRAGESLQEGQLKFRGRVPAPSVPCTINFNLSYDRGKTDNTNIGQYCYVGKKLRSGPCS